MTGLGLVEPRVATPEPGRQPLTPADLAELIGAFNEVTTRLQVSHDQLSDEVARLRERLREADEQLERSRRLAALGEMAAGIAHEIRNPLGSISLYVSMLGEDLRDRPSERGIASKIGEAVRGLNAVVCDVLAFAGEVRLTIDEVDVPTLLDEAVEHSGSGPAGVEIRRLDRARPAIVLACDRHHLGRALVNLVRTAREAVGESHREPGRIDLDAREEGGLVTVIVRDSGPGLCPEAVRRAFNPFFSTRQAGTGLGLSIVHRIVEAHAGSVRLRNNDPGEGPGATAEITLPGRRAGAVALRAPARPEEAQG